MRNGPMDSADSYSLKDMLLMPDTCTFNKV